MVIALTMSGFIALLLAQLYALELSSIDQDLKERVEPYATFAAHHLFKNRGVEEREPRLRLPGATEKRRDEPAFRQNESDYLPVDKATDRLNRFRTPCFIAPNGTVVEGLGTNVAWDRSPVSPTFANRLIYTTVYSTALAQNERVRVLSVPIYQHREVVGMVQVAAPLSDLDHRQAQRLFNAILLIPPAMLVVALGGLFLTNRALRPVRNVTLAAARIGEGDLSQRLTVRGDDELARLASGFNTMIAQLERAFQSRDTTYAQLKAAYEHQKRFTADASHELRTPLTRIKTATSSALQNAQSQTEYREALQIADLGADTMSRLISQLLLLARADSGQLQLHNEVIDLIGLLRDVSNLIEHPGIRIATPEALLLVAGDEALLASLFRNILENATRYTPTDGRITVSFSHQDNTILVKIVDTGVGIASNHLPHLFERFYRVDAARARNQGGTGLGLAICKSIVQAHHGEISISSRVGTGTEVTISLPISANPYLTDPASLPHRHDPP